MADTPKQTAAQERLTVKEFFEAVPPGRMVPVRDMGHKEVRQYGHSFRFVLPVIQLHCETESCNGIRFFQPANSENLEPKKLREHFVTFVCRNCGKTKKTYALWSFLSEDEVNGELLKFGEHPPFGPPTPARLISLIENQKNRILDEIIRVFPEDRRIEGDLG